MKRVTGIGGIFFKCKDPESIKKWYNDHLGIKSDQYGGAFIWREHNNPDHKGYTAWSPFSDDTKYFSPSQKEFMFNYRVEDLKKLLEILKLCSAAHIPDIWATQVLENLAKKGRPSRAEITDAAMAQRADCIMLNKGPHIIAAINMLDNIIRSMQKSTDTRKPKVKILD